MYLPPIITPDLAIQLEQAKGDYIESWCRKLATQPHNPFGITLSHRGKTRFFAARHLQGLGLFNQVIGIDPHDNDIFEAISQFYHDQGIERYRIEINPYAVSNHFLRQLASQRLVPLRFESALFTPYLTLPASLNETIAIQEVSSSEIDLFATLHCEGYQEALAHLSQEEAKAYHRCVTLLHGHQGWHLYIARKANTPCGMGMLFIQNNTATLAGGATLPDWRRQGCQMALIQHRLKVASTTQCSLLVSQASVGSLSQQNMQRAAGMFMAYTTTAWGT